MGSIEASRHRVATLSSCETPLTVEGLRSFIEACKILSRVIQGTTELLSPLDTAGRKSNEHIT